MYIGIHVHTHTPAVTCTFTKTKTHIHIYICTHMYTYTQTCIRIYICIYIYTICTYVGTAGKMHVTSYVGFDTGRSVPHSYLPDTIVRKTVESSAYVCMNACICVCMCTSAKAAMSGDGDPAVRDGVVAADETQVRLGQPNLVLVAEEVTFNLLGFLGCYTPNIVPSNGWLTFRSSTTLHK